MTSLPDDVNRFEFVRLSTLRTSQLIRGCTPRVTGSNKLTTTAQREVALGKVIGVPRDVNGPLAIGGR